MPMWTMTTRGFYSVVAHRDDPARVLVRARCERDLLALGDLLPDAQPTHTPDADYHWRFECTKAQWAGALAVMAGEVDYPNFKAAVTDRAHHRAYLEVWHALLSLNGSEATPEERIMLELAANPDAHYDPGDPDETSVTFISGDGGGAQGDRSNREEGESRG